MAGGLLWSAVEKIGFTEGTERQFLCKQPSLGLLPQAALNSSKGWCQKMLHYAKVTQEANGIPAKGPESDLLSLIADSKSFSGNSLEAAALPPVSKIDMIEGGRTVTRQISIQPGVYKGLYESFC
jgi:hypothetical protein